MVRRAVFVLVLAGAPACGLIVGIPDGRRLAGDAASALDGASEAIDGASPEAIAEGSNDGVVDASPEAPPADARVEAAPTDGPHDWCSTVAPAPLFCDDFDQGPLAADWTKQSPASGFVAVDTTQAQSPPSSLHVSIDAGGNPAGQVGYAAKTFGATPSRIEVAFALWPDTLVPADGANFVATIQVDQNTLTLYLNPSKTAWQEHVLEPDGGYAFPPDHAIAGGLSITSWTDVDAVIDFGQSPAHLTVTYGGTSVLDAPLDPSWAAAPWSLTLGPIFLNNTTDARSFHYDDVVVWTQP